MESGGLTNQIQQSVGRTQGSEALKTAALVEMIKPRVTLMVTLTAAAGYLLGAQGSVDAGLFFSLIVGVLLLAGGAAALNEVLESEADARMLRTRTRPLPSRRLEAAEALAFAAALSVAGSLFLAWAVNPLTALLGVLTSILYLFLYTPLKSLTPLATAVGAVPGAVPPVMGWAAARNDLGLEALVLFALLFFWQFPHFYAIAWLYREDYLRGGFRMLSAEDPQGDRTARHVVIHAALFAGAGILPAAVGMAGWIYLVGAALPLVWTFKRSLDFARRRDARSARDLVKASVIGLPVLLALLTISLYL